MKWDTKLSRLAIRYGELANVKSRNVRRIVVDGGIRSEESEKCTIAGPEQLLENILPVTAARFWNGEEEKECKAFQSSTQNVTRLEYPFRGPAIQSSFCYFQIGYCRWSRWQYKGREWQCQRGFNQAYLG